MTLKMRKLVMSDFGRYTCVITNSQGEASYTTLLKEVLATPAPITSSRTTSITTGERARDTFSRGMNPPTQNSIVYNVYDDETKNLSAPLIINMKPEIHAGKKAEDAHSVPSREQPYHHNRKSKNIARINIMDTARDLNSATKSSLALYGLIPVFILLWSLSIS
ncbi:hypothetical protein SK128_024352 [Halocaridina rubra]|uniref:Ig-like domain-containing protein n=1 Tax=Halocaridina rubra TaxID=373956 RepID=A0AAN9AEI1_HALRR